MMAKKAQALKMKSKTLIGLLLFALVLLGATIFLLVSGDRNAPEIFANNDSYIFHEGDSVEKMLTGVTATDEEDGDVTDSLIVESVREENDKVIIVYVAKDDANNVTKLRETYSVSPTEEVIIPEEPTVPSEPIITLKHDEIEVEVGSDFSYSRQVESIVDDKDAEKDLFKQIQIKGDQVNTEQEGTYEVIYYVVDSDGNKSNEVNLSVKVGYFE